MHDHLTCATSTVPAFRALLPVPAEGLPEGTAVWLRSTADAGRVGFVAIDKGVPVVGSFEGDAATHPATQVHVAADFASRHQLLTGISAETD